MKELFILVDCILVPLNVWFYLRTKKAYNLAAAILIFMAFMVTLIGMHK